MTSKRKRIRRGKTEPRVLAYESGEAPKPKPVAQRADMSRPDEDPPQVKWSHPPQDHH